MKKKRLVQGVGINDVDYEVTKYEYVRGEGGTRERRRVWICPYYQRWKEMLRRCYSEALQKKQPTYIGCTVSEEWKYLSVFKAWMERVNN